MTALAAGENVALTLVTSKLTVGFGWRIIASNSPDPELVPAAVLCNAQGDALDTASLVFHNQLATPEDSLRYVTDGDEEQIDVDISLIPAEVHKVLFLLFVDPELRRPGTFASASNVYLRLADRAGNDVARFDLGPTPPSTNVVLLAELYRYASAWKFRALGETYDSGIAGVATSLNLGL
ncbi:TerD family protein [Rathayibacter rathayi]|uniref:TerD family protein n=1 Tax=Rathayibacter rathayi TaxID=33887 RepID=UPI000CE92367|nr:TerD family protein [Rathayibacter rathayi]PPG14404.1 hypothetical protein C5C11_05035 [Rathayibacter rathayi]